MRRSLLLPLLLIAAAFLPAPEPDPMAWRFEAALADEGFVARSGSPPAPRTSAVHFAPDEVGSGLVFNEREDALVIAETLDALPGGLPTRSLSVSAWVAIERPQRWGGLVGCVQDDGDVERGFVLGHDTSVFSFGLASAGADDGDGRLTYLAGSTPWVAGRWHHVAATYDGERMRLYVDGKLDGESTEQSGDVRYPAATPLILGAYRDANEDFPLDGRLLSARISAEVWSAEDVRAAFLASSDLADLPPWTDTSFGFLVEPFLTWPAEDAVSVQCELTVPAGAWLELRRDDQPAEGAWNTLESPQGRLHTWRPTGLAPDQKYFYRVSARDGRGHAVESPLLSFRTAASAGRPFTFVVIGDTQTQGDVAQRVSDIAWMHRPNLVLHAGDLVDTGSNQRDWTDTFFPSMQPLIGRVPLMPVLGNHEQDARLYYDYMDLPEPERWYSFRYGDAEFFMIDGNRSLAQQSEQLAWLEGALAASTATWRFAVLHQPPYTSDSNDYGDTTVGDSFRGDANVRHIVALLERHDVDLCFSGHVHDYERTFPIRDGRVTPYEEGGVIYVTAAGGGGPLEDFDPANTWFGHKKARYHHLVYVAIHADRLEFQAIDEHGRLFDVLSLRKRR